MPPYLKKYSIAYFLTCFASLFFIDIGYSFIEMSLKLLALLSLSFMYLRAAKKVNYWYLLVLLNSIASDSFLIFDDNFLLVGTVLLVMNRFLYIIIARRALYKTSIKKLLIYILPFLLIFVGFYALMRPYSKEISTAFLLLVVTSAVMILFSFFNFLNKMNTENKYYLIGMLLIVGADVLIAYNKFLDYNLWYVACYTSMYYVARYLICRAMILDKR